MPDQRAGESLRVSQATPRAGLRARPRGWRSRGRPPSSLSGCAEANMPEDGELGPFGDNWVQKGDLL